MELESPSHYTLVWLSPLSLLLRNSSEAPQFYLTRTRKGPRLLRKKFRFLDSVPVWSWARHLPFQFLWFLWFHSIVVKSTSLGLNHSSATSWPCDSGQVALLLYASSFSPVEWKYQWKPHHWVVGEIKWAIWLSHIKGVRSTVPGVQ